MKKGKLIHLTQRCIYNLSVLAAKKKTNFKNLVEGILENESKEIDSDCEHDWFVDMYDHFGFPSSRVCDKCNTRESV
jgi:hypothetical protein